MNWKEFFKPTIWKVAVFLIISLVFVPFIRYDNGIRCFIAPCPADTTGSVLMWLLAKRYAGHVYEVQYSYLIVGMILSYLASALITETIDKRKK